LIYKN